MASSFGRTDASLLFSDDTLERAWGSLSVMGRVIYAIVLREARTRYGQSALGYAWALIDPLVEIWVMIILFTAFGRRTPIPVPLPVFLLTGLLPFNFFKNCMSRGATAASSNAALLTYPQVKVASVLIGRTVLEAVTTCFIYILFVLLLRVLMDIPFSTWYDHSLGMFMAMMGIFLVGLGGSFFSSSMTRLTPFWASIWSYLGRPLWFLSGIFFSLSTLPSGPKRYMVYNPLAHMLEWWRSISLSQFESIHYKPWYVVCFGLFLLGFGLLVDRALALVGHTDEGH